MTTHHTPPTASSSPLPSFPHEGVQRNPARAKVRAEAEVAYGGKCEDCGTSDGLEFQRHVDGNHDTYRFLRSLRARGWPREAVSLVCRPCRADRTAKADEGQGKAHGDDVCTCGSPFAVEQGSVGFRIVCGNGHAK